MMKSFILSAILLTTCLFSIAQEKLDRKAWLGARIEPTESNGQFALNIVEVRGGTSESLQLKANDIILNVNDRSFANYPDFSSFLQGSVAGSDVKMVVLRNNKKITLKGKFVGRPFETDDNAEVIYDSAPYKDGHLRVIINKPKSEAKLPAMLFVPGYTCSSIDNLESNHPYKRIIDAYVDAGFVTLRIEKSGLGDSKNTPTCESCDLDDEIENFQVGLNKLKSLPYVDTTRIIIFGHSMGGIIVPALTAKNNVAGAVVYGTTAKSWFEYQIEMNRVQNLLAGMDPLTYEKSIRDQYEINYRFFVKDEPLSEIAKDTTCLRLMQENWQYDGDKMIFSRNAEYWRQIQSMPLLENWKNTQAKVLVLFGESDFQAFSKADHEQIVFTVNHYHPKNASLITFPETDHYFAKSGTMQEAWDKFIGGQYLQLFNEYNPEVGKKAVDWSRSVLTQETDQVTIPTWNKLNTEPYAGKQDDICFINRKEGWYVNGFGAIYHTTDGGLNWEKQLEKKGTFFRCIAFVDEKIGFAGTVGTDYFPNVTDTIPLYGTNDGGKTWNPVKYEGPYVKGLCAIDIVREQFINHGVIDYKVHLFAVGRVGSPANFMKSSDGGKTWTAHSMESDCQMLFDIKMFDKDNGFVCAATSEDLEASHALILRTSDGGKSWQKVYESARPYETTWKASFPSKNTGYVTIQSYNPDQSISQQRIAKTTDGGKTWTELPLVQDAGAREFGIGFIDEKHGFVGTLNSGFETTDGGATWNKIDLGRACNKIRIYRDDQGVYGYAIGVHVFKFE